jgi:hypothetical protein
MMAGFLFGDEMEKTQETDEFRCLVCGDTAVVEVTNICSQRDSGSYCSVHGPKPFPPTRFEDRA